MPKYIILCVDDERNVLLTLRTQLMRYFPDYKIEIAESGIEALEVLNKEIAKGKQIPLVIVDQIMPMMKGDELLIEIHARYPDINKVMLTGQARADEVGNVVNCANLYRFISKPWNEIDLQLTVTEGIRRYEQDRLIIQQQQALEANLQQSQYFIKRVTESVPNLLHILDIAEQTNIYANYATKKLFGYSDDEIKQLGFKLFTDNCHPEDCDRFYESLHKSSSLQDGEFVEAEYRIKNIQGQWRWLLCHNTVFLRTADGAVKQILVSCQDVSDRKQVEINLIESEERFRATFEQAAVGIFQSDLNGKYIQINQKYCKILGYSEAEILSLKSFTEITHPDDLQEVTENCRRLLSGELQTFTLEKRSIRKDGEIIWVNLAVSLTRNFLGEPQYFIGIVKDISDRQKAEESLKAQNRWLSCVALNQPLKPTLELLIELIELQLDGGTCSILLVDNNKHLIPCAAPNLPIGYLKVGDRILIGEGVGSCGTAAFRRELVIVSDIATDPIWKDIKNLALVHDLKACWSIPILSFNQEKVLGVFGIYYQEVRQPSPREIKIIKNAAISAGLAIERYLNELTIQRQLQQEQFLYRHLQSELNDRQKAEAMLSESEELFRRAFEDAATGIALINLEGKFIQVNHSICELLGYRESELLEKYFQDLTFPDDLQRNLKLIEQLLAAERTGFQMEKRYIHRQGQVIWVILSLSLIRDSFKTPLYFVAQLQDITARHELDRTKDQFISVVSHELRTPLTAIRGALGILTTGIYDQRPQKSKRMLEIALNNSDRLSRLVNDILDLERLESGQSNLIMGTCEVSNLLKQAKESVKEIANQADIKIKLVPLSVEIFACADAIVQVLVNLLGNAIKFSNAGSQITLSVKLVADHICFAVIDQGRGIPPEHLETIFGRFQQVDISDARQKGGSGLGLAISKSLIHQHHGKIWVESTIGQGSTFSFSLPLSISP